MKKIRSFSLFLALFLLFSFTSCDDESGEITTEYISTINTEVITQEPETQAPETEETTAAGIDTSLIIEITAKPETEAVTEPEVTTEIEVTTEAEITTEPEVTTSPETTKEPEITTPVPEQTTAPITEETTDYWEETTAPLPETTKEETIAEVTTEVEVTTEPETTPEPEVTTLPEPETTPEPEVTTLPEPETTPEPEITTLPESETTPEPEVTTLPEPETTPVPETTVDPAHWDQFDPAPDFTVYDKNGQGVKLSAMKGTPVILNFWASWCPPCKAEMPDFDEISKKFEGKVAFMMVNLTGVGGETQSSAQAFIDSMGYSFPVYFDHTGEAVYNYGIESIPTTFFIDSHGCLVAYARGAISGDILEGAILTYLLNQ